MKRVLNSPWSALVLGVLITAALYALARQLVSHGGA